MRRKVGLLAVTAVGALAVGLALVDRQVTRRYGRPPRRSVTTSAARVDAIDVAITAVNGATLRGWLREAPAVATGNADEPTPAALVIHGWGGSSAEMFPVSEPLLNAGLHVLLLDARGHGRSDDADVTSMPSFAEDIRAAVAWLRIQPQVDPARIVLVGHSVGAGACLFAAADDPAIAAVVSLASMADPAALMSDLMRQRLPRPLTPLALRYVEHAIGHRFAEFAPIQTIGQIRVPILLLHGDRDTTISPSDAYRLHAQAPTHSALIVMPDADHNSIEALEGVTPAVLSFLRSADVTGTARPN